MIRKVRKQRHDGKEASIATRKRELVERQKKLVSTATIKGSEHSDEKRRRSNDDKQATKENNDKMQREEQRSTPFLGHLL